MFRKSVVFSGGAAYISFDYAEELSTSDGKSLRTFEVAEDDGYIIIRPQAEIVENGKIKVYSDRSEKSSSRCVTDGNHLPVPIW